MEETVSDEIEAVSNVETAPPAGGGYGCPLIVDTPPMLKGSFSDK
jgi:hypothetical protein